MICRHIPLRLFEIKHPRYHDRKVLLKASRIGGHNKVVFSEAPSLGTDPYYISGKIAKKYKKESNGTIQCYSIPLDELKPFELTNKCIHEM